MPFIFLICSISGYSAKYYFSTSGSDSNSGLTTGLPKQTLTAANALTLAANDSILFKRGDTFLGSLTAQRWNMGYGAYGTGNKPVISGFQTITGWSDQGSGIYRASATASASCNMVTVDGVSKAMGRWPKTDWLTMTTSTGRTSFTDDELPASPSWTGAEVVIKKNNWTIDRSLITNHSGTTITYTSGSTNNPVAVDGLKQYFFQKSLTTLSQTGTTLGEWYCDGTYLYMYFGANDPTSYVVKASTVTTVLTINGKNTVAANNLTIEGGNSYNVYIPASVNITLNNCSINFSGNIGVYAPGSPPVTIDGCNISDSNGCGIYMTGNGSIIRDCVINNSGLLSGMGGTDGFSYWGVRITSTGGLVEYNQITNCGYCGLMFYNNNFIVRYNKIDTNCSILTDGACIYTFIGNPATSSGQRVHNNILLNGNANGLYNDNNANHIEWDNNTVINMAKSGMHMNDPYFVNVHNNTFFNAVLTGISIQNLHMGGGYAHDNTLSSNVIAQGVNTARMTSLIDNSTFTTDDFGTSDNNTFVVESTGLNVHKAEWVLPSYTLNNYTFAGWKTFTGQESETILKAKVLSSLRLEYNDTKSPITVQLGANYKGITSDVDYTEVTLQPFTSVLLYRQDPDPVPGDRAAGTYHKKMLVYHKQRMMF